MTILSTIMSLIGAFSFGLSIVWCFFCLPLFFIRYVRGYDMVPGYLMGFVQHLTKEYDEITSLDIFMSTLFMIPGVNMLFFVGYVKKNIEVYARKLHEKNKKKRLENG